MITIAELPVLTHSETTHQFSELGIPLDKSDLVQVRANVNMMKVSVALPRGTTATRIILPGQPLRVELPFSEFIDVTKHSGVPFIRVPVPFSEVVAKQLVDKDDMSEFLPSQEEIVEGIQQEAELNTGVRDIEMIVNILNIAHYGSLDGERTTMVIIGMPQPLPISISPIELKKRIVDAMCSVNGIHQMRTATDHGYMYNNFYDACPMGWGKNA